MKAHIAALMFCVLGVLFILVGRWMMARGKQKRAREAEERRRQVQSLSDKAFHQMKQRQKAIGSHKQSRSSQRKKDQFQFDVRKEDGGIKGPPRPRPERTHPHDEA